MVLVVLSGLPGTGKSAIAEAIASHVDSPVFAKDWLQATLARSGLTGPPDQDRQLGYAGYELLTTLAFRRLQLGQSAILDSVAGFEHLRRTWRELARQYRAYGAPSSATVLTGACTASDWQNEGEAFPAGTS